MKKRKFYLLLPLFLTSLVTGCQNSETNRTEILSDEDQNISLIEDINGKKFANDGEDSFVFPDYVTIHYHRDDNDYENKRFWLWSDLGAPEREFPMVKDDDGYSYSFTFSPAEIFENVGESGFSFMVKTTNTWSGKSAEIPIEYKDYPPTLMTSGEYEGKYVLDFYAIANGTNLDIFKTKEDALSDQIAAAFISSDYKKINIYTKDGTGNGTSVISSLKIYKFTNSYFRLSTESQIARKKDYLLSEFNNVNKTNVAISYDKKLTINAKYQIELEFVDKPGKWTVQAISYENLYNTEEFNALNYSGDDLGATVKDNKTTFKLWAPTASRLVLKIYDVGYDKSYLTADKYNDIYYQNACDLYTTYEMKLNLSTFVWEKTIDENLSGKYYTYKVYNTLGAAEIVDPYAMSASIDGKRGMITDFSSKEATPDNWDDVPLVWDGKEGYDIKTPQELAISEVHIRDLTMSSTWNGPSELKGTYKGFIESGTTYTSEKGVTVKTGYDHLVEYGVNALQILPFFDQDNAERARKPYTFNEGTEKEVTTGIVDYTTQGDFNWGYNPLNYNVIEGAYSSDPTNGYSRVKEFRELVSKFALNENHTRIIMDVVYNHVSSAPTSNFEKLMPKYYYRYNSDGSYSDASGCGNEVKTEAPMMRKFIVDSVCHFAKDYKIKGFRFDLMGAIDIGTMSAIADALYKIDKDIVVYGEGWYAASPRLGGNLCSVNQNIGKYLYPNRGDDAKYKGEGSVGGFNNGGRDGLKGDNSITQNNFWGFIGKGSTDIEGTDLSERVQLMMMGANKLDGCPRNPLQNVNYVSCHDNYTLFDQLNYILSDDGGKTEPNIETVAKASASVNGMVLMSNAISFINGGEELFRTKIEDNPEAKDEYCATMYGKRISHNSYKSSDFTNAYDYSRKADLLTYFNMYKDLVSLKKNLIYSSEIVVKDDNGIYHSGNDAYVVKNGTHGTQVAVTRSAKNGKKYHICLNGRNSESKFYAPGEVKFTNYGTALKPSSSGFDVNSPYTLVIIEE